MKAKHFSLAIVLALSTLALAGCGGQNNSTHQNNSAKSEKMSQSSNKKSKDSSTKKSAALWNNSKEKKLQSYMEAFSGSRNMALNQYNGKGKLVASTSVTHPAAFSKAKVNGTKDTIGWSKQGNGKYDYNVVAIYDYDNEKSALPSHQTYFFAFNKKKPVVLISKSQSSKPVIEKDNEAQLQGDFSKIAKNQPYENPMVGNMKNYQPKEDDIKKPSDADITMTDPKLIGIMTFAYTNPGYEPNDEHPVFMYTTDDGRYEIDLGNMASEMTYKLEGDTVHYWIHDLQPGKSMAESGMKESTVSLEELISKYYTTDDQKQQVQRAADIIEEQ